MSRAVGALAAALLLAGAASASASGLQLVPLVGPGGAIPFKSPGGFGPTFLVSPPGDTHREFVGTKDGYIYVIDDGVLQPTPFLDLHTKVSTYNEDGMLDMAFDPNYATNHRFYVDYTDTANSVDLNLENYHLDEFQTEAGNPDRADQSSETQILALPTTGCTSMTSPHYGGQLQFGPDGALWLTIGDGGDGCSDDFNALSLSSLHGKMLRIIPEPTQAPDASGNRYAIPSGNPLVGESGVDQEIWAYGLRNPYRFSFDAGKLIIADVGNSIQEEIDVVPDTLSPGAPPPFFGWPCLEGTYVTPSISCPVTQTPVAPVLTYMHGANSMGNPYCTAIIGGYVLHDPSLGGDYDGRYLYGYFCAAKPPGLSGELLTTNIYAASPVPREEGLTVGIGLSSFGLDACGHPYAMNVLRGGLWRVEGATPGGCGEFIPPQTTLSSAPSGIVHSTSATVTFSSSTAGSSFSCSLDGAAAQPCSSPATFSGLADGPHKLSVTAIDQAGNADPTPAGASWIVDTGPPITTITAAPPSSAKTPIATIAFIASESDVTFACSLDGQPAQPCTSPATYKGLEDGRHTFTVTATDAAGNVETPGIQTSWVVALPPIRTSLASKPPIVVVSENWRLHVTLRALAQNATGSYTLRRGKQLLGRARHFNALAGKPIRLVVVLPPSIRRLLTHHAAVKVRLFVTMTAADGQVAKLNTSLTLTRAGA